MRRCAKSVLKENEKKCGAELARRYGEGVMH